MANNEVFGVSGWIARPTRRLYIVNGSDLVTAKKQQAFLPTADPILSGEPVVRVWGSGDNANGQVFKKATGNDSKAPVYFANADAGDWDVKASGKLPAIFAGDDFEIQTPFFDTTVEYKPGAALYIGAGNAGNVDGHAIVTTTESTDKTIVGYVSKGVIDLGSINKNDTQNGVGTDEAGSQNVPAGGEIEAPNGVTNSVKGGPRAWTNDTGSQYVLQFYTKFIPAQA